MTYISSISPGTKFDNVQLCDIFGCSSRGGMRRAHKTNTLVIISNHFESIYDDRWEGDMLHYTGMGTKGDQSLSFAQNKTLAESETNGVDVHLFEVFVDKEYTYVGQVKLCGKPYQEQQRDGKGNNRLTYVFPLKVLMGARSVSREDQQVLDNQRVKKAKNLSDESLKERAEKGRKKPSTYQQSTIQYERSIWVAEYAKRLAKGICQLCLNLAPFENAKGVPYLETHHIVWLAKGGEDVIANTVALCPNCHKKMHIVGDPKDIETLQLRAKLLGDAI
ncbi:HNH endonuclease [Providencia vermicola]|uniref:HNH endonuclease n=1 Tax=Providencia vermicola TaxID=333965 RepID=UPI0032DBE03D